jgi:FKBP-type peptidyl-prolyl cis-trans isomerase (trigger factor)
MQVFELFRHFQMMQRTLSSSTASESAFKSGVRALTDEFRREVKQLDDLALKTLCADIGQQLEHELELATEDRRRQVLSALLNVVEDVEFRRGLR